MSEQVLCKDCRFCVGGYFYYNCDHPTCFQKATRFDPFWGEVDYSRRVSNSDQLNSDGNCNLYRRKWWKFWR